MEGWLEPFWVLVVIAGGVILVRMKSSGSVLKTILKWILGIVLYIFLMILFVDGRHWLESRFREDDGVKIELLRSAII